MAHRRIEVQRVVPWATVNILLKSRQGGGEQTSKLPQLIRHRKVPILEPQVRQGGGIKKMEEDQQK